MPVYQVTPAANSSTSVVFGQFGRFVSNIHLAVRDWNDRRVTRKLLSGLTDRELNDIGLMRAELDNLK